MTNSLMILDGTSYLYRAFFAMSSITNRRGHPVGAIMGFNNFMNRFLKEYKPRQAVMVFDSGGKCFRHSLYERYKANRPPTPQDLKCQFPRIIQLAKALGFPTIIKKDVEADDVIGTLSKKFSSMDKSVAIFSTDKDMIQLINERTVVVCPKTGRIINRKNAGEKYGIPAELFIDYLTLVGDQADNIPGVECVGPKTACRWLCEYKSLDNIVANADKIIGKAGENLRRTIPSLPLFKKLVTIKCDLEIEMEEKDLNLKNRDSDTLKQIYEFLKM